MRNLLPRLPTLRLATFAGALVALAGALALAALAAALTDPAARAETGFLALSATAVLLPAALALPAAAGEIALAALGVNLAAWLLPAGAQRGAAVALVLAGGVALAAAKALRPAGLSPRSPTLPLFALALAALFASARLLQPDPAALTLAVVFPALLAGLAASSLVVSRGAVALVAAGTVLVGAGGPGWEAAAALAGLAVAEQARLGRLRPAVALPLLAGAALPFRDQPLVALALFAAGVVLATERVGVRLAVAAALVAALLLLGPAGTTTVALLIALAPAPLLSLPAGAARWRALTGIATATLIALAGGSAALAAAVGLALLICPPGAMALRLQAGWTGWLLAASALVAAYPWLRGEPLASALALWGLRLSPSGNPGGASDPWFLAPLAGLALALALFRLAGRRAEGTARSWATVLPPLLPVIALVLVGVSAPVERLLGGEPLVLSAQRPAWSARPAAGSLRSVAVDAALSNSTALPRGGTVAFLRVRFADGRVEERPLRSGIELDEWAARRPDVARTLGATPQAWTSWIPPGGEFFGQRYRARLELSGRDASEVEVRLAEGLPESLSLALYRIEVGR